MSEQKEMPDRIWVYKADGSRESGSWTNTCTGDNEVEYRRIPSLPDVMEDGYVVMEWGGWWQIRAEITPSTEFGLAVYERHGPKWEFKDWLMHMEPLQELLGLYDEDGADCTHHVQNGQIVRVK